MDAREAAIVDQVLAGDANAFRHVVDDHSRNLYLLALRMTGRPEAAEDVVQEALLRAYRSLHRFDRASSLGTWLHRITVNQALDFLRRQQRQHQRFESLDPHDSHAERATSSTPGPDRHVLSREIDQQVERALGSLSPMERTAFVLRHFEHQTSTEIAHALGTRPVTARQAVFRAVAKLRQILRPPQETPDAALS